MPAWNIETKISFSPLVTIGDHVINIQPNWTIVINGTEYQIVREAASVFSDVIKEHVRINPESDRYIVKTEVDSTHIAELLNLFLWKPIEISNENLAFFQKIHEELQIPFIAQMISVFQNMDLNADQALNESCPNLEKTESLITEIFNETRKPSGLIEKVKPQDICHHLFTYCVARPHRIEEVIDYISDREDLYPVFGEYVIKKYTHGSEFTQELSLMIEKLLSKNRLKFQDLHKINLPFNLIQYADHEQFDKTLKDATEKYPNLINIEKLKAKDWQLQRQLASEGVNPDDIATSIRNDDLKTFKILCRNPNATILPSPYERCSFINKCERTLLEYAAFFGALKCFSYLQLNNAKMSRNMYQFAIAGGNTQILKICETYHTPYIDTLRAAIIYHRPDICENYFVNDHEILEKCIEFNQTQVFLNFVKENQNHNSLLFEVCRQDNTGFLEILFRCNDLDLNARQERTQKCALQICCENGCYGTLKQLSIQEKIDLNARNPNDNDSTLLHYACGRGDMKTVKLLFESPFLGDINETNVYGMTPLHCACSEGQAEVVTFLLSKKKCNRDAKTQHGYTALHLACKNGHANVVSILIKNGFDINAKGFYNNTPLYFASQSGCREAAVYLLKRKDIEVNARGENGNTALHVAAAAGDAKMVKLLLKKKGIDRNLKNRDGKLPTRVAATKQIEELIATYNPNE
ncbi:hypothetical protein TRFO_30244 [Tritrichomonas foetus]|uniref:DUF3447 domain-containing protein n=1 Tax=Tritrichomonas foetus TaxID=1144522 RepID=A0A1J4JUA4_9EUKA|nr:hypothetical protein TRFO_30244 [Tritrichomonas foetus]|eukprot:OHT02579.1 hypothetical protein TRFO_30244 [Tritrichomonas foetus]